mmetsp:Transcript_59040/g.133710  ORF Transcript_59040/g.133710 Transcript_59040/m.133710 type:complete len:203 (+) Transcript_59040:228-836(+)
MIKTPEPKALNSSGPAPISSPVSARSSAAAASATFPASPALTAIFAPCAEPSASRTIRSEAKARGSERRAERRRRPPDPTEDAASNIFGTIVKAFSLVTSKATPRNSSSQPPRASIRHTPSLPYTPDSTKVVASWKSSSVPLTGGSLKTTPLMITGGSASCLMSRHMSFTTPVTSAGPPGRSSHKSNRDTPEVRSPIDSEKS